jgi:ABC-type multidrug transport system ATPase subunit
VLARALLMRTSVVYLDEPTVGLGPDGARRIPELVLRINREEHVTILLTTHLMYEAYGVPGAAFHEVARTAVKSPFLSIQTAVL